MAEMSVADAAKHLRVSPHRVRAMLHANVLSGRKFADRWMVDVGSLGDARQRAGRPYSPRVAWALVQLAAGERPAQLSQPELSRLRARWNAIKHAEDPAQALAAALAARARRSFWSSPDPEELRADRRLVLSGKSDPRSGISARHIVEAYAQSDDLQGLIADHLLVPAGRDGNVILHEVAHPVPGVAPWLLVAADLAEGDAREKGRARELIKQHADA